LTKNGHVYVYKFFYFFRISTNFRNLYVVCFILATGQIFSLEGGVHTIRLLGDPFMYYSVISDPLDRPIYTRI